MIAFWVSFLAAALAARPILSALRAMKSRQTVSQYAPETHQVKQGTPTMGGLIVLVGILAGLIYALATGTGENRLLLAALLTTILFGLIGFVDDFVVPRLMKGKRGLGWKQKILMQVGASVLAALPVTGLAPVPLGVAVFVLLFASNAYNFADGLDGLAAGIGISYCGGVWGLASVSGDTPLATIALVVAAGLAGFLFLNAHPARIFMGDVGSLPIGALFGLATLALPNAPALLRAAGGIGPSPTAFVLAGLALNLMLAAELLPVPIQIASVKLRGKRVFPCTPIHHAFEKAGWPETRVVAAFTLVQLLASALALTLVLR